MYKDLMWLGITLGSPYEPMNGFFGFCRYLFQPDFVFITNGIFDEHDYDYDLLNDAVFRYLYDKDIVILALRGPREACFVGREGAAPRGRGVPTGYAYRIRVSRTASDGDGLMFPK